MAGLYFEEFKIGQVFNHEIRRTLLESDNMLYSAMTYNPAAIHIDHEYCKSTQFGKPLMNSMLTIGVVIGLSVQDTTLGTTVANLGLDELKFPAPVFAGDTIRSRTTVMGVRESRSNTTQGIVTFRHRGINQDGLEIASCVRSALMYKRAEAA